MPGSVARPMIGIVGTSAQPPTSSEEAAPTSRTPVSVLDVAAGASAAVVDGVVAVGRRAAVVIRPVARVALHPPLLAPRHHPGSWLEALGRRGREQRTSTGRDLSGLLDALVPAILSEVLRRADLTAAVKQYVELDAIVAGVDLDAAAARLDVDAVARRLDLDAVLDRLDLTTIVLERVDLDLVVGDVDLDAAAGRLDVDAVARRLDLDAVIKRIDLVGLAEEVISAIDLPEIIRESTGSVASDTVRGVRMQGIASDEAVGRAVDRLLLRRGRRSTHTPRAEVVSEHDGEDQVPPQREPEATSRQP